MLHKSTIRIIILLSFVMAVFSTLSLNIQEKGIYDEIGFFIYSGIISKAFFTPFEIIILAFLFNLTNRYRLNLKFSSGLFLFALFAYLIRMANPYSDTQNPILGMPLLSELSEYIFLLMLLVLMSLPAITSKLILETIFKYVVIFSVVKATILLLNYLIGNITSFRFNIAIILDEPDSQFLFAFLGAILLSNYLVTRKVKYLLASIIFLSLVTFSMQRSTALTGLIAVFLLLLFTMIKALPMAAGRSFMIVTLAIVIFLIVSFQFSDSTLSFTMNRYSGIMNERNEVSNKAFSDTGHKEQSLVTFLSIWQEKPFWGIGYGKANDRLYLAGQTSNIHNTYATLWAQHGIVTLLFYILIFVSIIRHVIKLMSKIDKSNYKEYLNNLTAGYYLFSYFVAAWVMSGNVFMFFRLQVFWFLIYIYLTRSINLNYIKIDHGRSH